MRTLVNNTQATKTNKAAAQRASTSKAGKTLALIADNRPQTIAQRKLQKQVDAMATTLLQRKKENQTGLPDNLKNGVESLSGVSLDQVKVHYNSSKPAQLNALAYAQGTDIHVAPGQEQHLPHEAWHVAQQAQGRVKPTMQMQSGVSINDDQGLEREADVMGNKAMQAKSSTAPMLKPISSFVGSIQRVKDESLRVSTDPQMDGLKKRTTNLLELLNKRGQNWKGKWGEEAQKKVQEKTKGVLNGEKGESLESMAVKQAWSMLSTQEKMELILEAAKQGSKIFRSVWEEIPEREKSKPKPKAPEKPKKQERSSPEEDGDSMVGGAFRMIMSSLGELESNDIETMYQVMKKKREISKKVENAKEEIEKRLGKFGKKTGEFVGEFRDEHEFENLIEELTGEFQSAKGIYQKLRSVIEENDDLDRYEAELNALQDVFSNIHGPYLAFIARGQLIPQARLEYPKLCEIASDNIDRSSRKRGFFEGLVSGVKSGLGLSEPDYTEAQEEAASALRKVLRMSWSKVTSWGWTPDGVKEIRTVSISLDAAAYLEAAKQKAGGFPALSKNRHAVTQEFYDTLQSLNTKDNDSLRNAFKVFKKTEKHLA